MPGSPEYIPKEYWEKRLGERFTLGGVGHLGFGETYNKWAYKRRAEVLRQLINRGGFDTRGKSVLDIGAGNGYYIDIWTSLGVGELTGLDITAKSVSELSRHFPRFHFIEADITDENLSIDGTFDIITAFDVLFHIVDDDRFRQGLANIARLSHESSVVLITDFFLERRRLKGGHQDLRTQSEYVEALRDNDMRIVELKTIFTVMNPPFDSARIHGRAARALVKATWWLNRNIASLSARAGLVGRALMSCWAPVLYLADRSASRLLDLGPSTKLALVRRPAVAERSRGKL